MLQVTGGWSQLRPRNLPPIDGYTPPNHLIRPQSVPTPPAGHHIDSKHDGPRQTPRPSRAWVEAFLIDETEVTRAAYKAFLDSTGYRPPFVAEDWARKEWNWSGTDYPPGTADHPVVMVSFFDAQEYCAWRGGRLPTESEWQLAAMGPLEHDFSFPWGYKYDPQKLNHGKVIDPNFDESDGYKTTAPVGAFPAGRSWFGLLDTYGNAWEWTSSYGGGDLPTDEDSQHVAEERAKRAAGLGHYVSVRGGSYYFDLRFNPGAERNSFKPELRRKTSGFRCAK